MLVITKMTFAIFEKSAFKCLGWIKIVGDGGTEGLPVYTGYTIPSQAKTVVKTKRVLPIKETNFRIFSGDQRLIALVQLVVLSCAFRLPPELLLDGDAPRAKANSAGGNNSTIFPDRPGQGTMPSEREP